MDIDRYTNSASSKLIQHNNKTVVIVIHQPPATAPFIEPPPHATQCFWCWLLQPPNTIISIPKESSPTTSHHQHQSVASSQPAAFIPLYTTAPPSVISPKHAYSDGHSHTHTSSRTAAATAMMPSTRQRGLGARMSFYSLFLSLPLSAGYFARTVADRNQHHLFPVSPLACQCESSTFLLSLSGAGIC